MPRLLHPAQWLVLIETLPRVGAMVFLLACLSMLALGLKGFKLYFCAGVGLLAWAMGVRLATLMHVTYWFVAAPMVLLGVALAWPASRYAAPLVVGFVAACTLGTFVAAGLDLGGFWIAFPFGLFGGVLFAVLAPRFSVAVLCAAVGSVGVVAALGAVVRAKEGLLSPGAYARDPVIFVIAGALLFVVGLVAQVALEPDPLDDMM